MLIGLQAGVTARRKLALRLMNGDESELMESIRTAELVVAVKAGDITEVKRLLTLEGADINAQDYVSSSLIDQFIVLKYELIIGRYKSFNPCSKNERSLHV